MITIYNYNGEEALLIEAVKQEEGCIRCSITAKLKWCTVKSIISLTLEELSDCRKRLQDINFSVPTQSDESYICLTSPALSISAKLNVSGSMIWNIQLKDKLWNCSFRMKADVTGLPEIIYQIEQFSKDFIISTTNTHELNLDSCYLLSFTQESRYRTLFECSSNTGCFQINRPFTTDEEELCELKNNIGYMLRYGTRFVFEPFDDYLLRLSFMEKDDTYIIDGAVEVIDSGKLSFTGRLDYNNLCFLTTDHRGINRV